MEVRFVPEAEPPKHTAETVETMLGRRAASPAPIPTLTRKPPPGWAMPELNAYLKCTLTYAKGGLNSTIPAEALASLATENCYPESRAVVAKELRAPDLAAWDTPALLQYGDGLHEAIQRQVRKATLDYIRSTRYGLPMPP